MVMSSRPVDYALVLDAGSSGTRLYVYRWRRWNKEDGSLPVIEIVHEKKQDGGIAKLVKGSNLHQEAMQKFKESVEKHLKEREVDATAAKTMASEASAKMFSSHDLQSAVNEHLEPLFKAAHEFLAPIQVKPEEIPLFLLGTAGIRDLKGDLEEKYKELLGCMKASTERAGFKMEECGAISGEAEALYASAQIAFMPHKVNQDYKDDMWKVRIGSLELDLFLGSYPFGNNLASKTYRSALKEEAPEEEKTAKVIKDPSKPGGLKEKFGDCELEGVPNAAALKTKVSGVLTQLAGDAFNAHLSTALKGRKFVGGANFWYSTRQIFGLDINGKPKKTAFSFTEFRDEVLLTSLLPWNALKKRTPNVKESYLAGAWFQAAWVECVLTEYFGFTGTDGHITQEDSLSFRPYNGSDGMELTWTLGRLILFITGDKPPAYIKGSDIIEINKLRQKASDFELEASKLVDSAVLCLHLTLDNQELGPSEALRRELQKAGYYIVNVAGAKLQASDLGEDAGFEKAEAIWHRIEADKKEDSAKEVRPLLEEASD